MVILPRMAFTMMADRPAAAGVVSTSTLAFEKLRAFKWLTNGDLAHDGLRHDGRQPGGCRRTQHK